MITFFTTTKPFTGQNKINQINALKNWRYVVPNCEILIFDKLTEAEDLISELKIINITEIQKSNIISHLPLVNDMFYKASEHSKHPICCYLNSDILLPDDFCDKIKNIHNQFKFNYLIVGQRYDLDITDYIIFNTSWEKDLLQKNEIKLHPPFGSDFFIFPKNQYLKGDIPNLIVGRPGWDNWFIYNGVTQRGLKVLDISNFLLVYHQNHKTEYFNSIANKEQTDLATKNNLQFFPKDEEYNYVLQETNYYIANNKIKKRKKKKNFLRKKLKSLYNLFLPGDNG